jgi:hypothetical protein
MVKLQADKCPPPASARTTPDIDPPAAIDLDDYQFNVKRLVRKRIRRVRKRKSF